MIKEILNGWYRLLFNPYEKSKERNDICDKCESRGFISCKECGCVIVAKINCSICECPLGKW